MRHSLRLLPPALAAVVTVGGLAGLTPAPAAGGPAPSVAPDGPRERVIVQLDEPGALRQTGPAGRPLNAASAAAMRSLDTARTDVRQEQGDLLAAARSAGVDVRQIHSFTDLIAGLAVSVPASDVDDISGLPGVRAVYPDQPMRASTDTSVPLVGAPQVWERTDSAGQQVRGDGVTVAILDTGIDYNLDSLGGGFGPEHKVVDGYDFVNDDADPMDDNGHGTHVAGIVAGNGAVTGMAPDASLTAYKVLADDGGGLESDIIAGLEAAVAPDNPHRADVVNMSLGGPGDGRDPVGLVATAATQEGAVVVASAGNSGPAAGTVGTPAAADGVISVGASVSGVRVPTAYIESPQHQLLQAYRGVYSANPPAESVSGELVDVARGTDADYARVGDVTGKVVAIQSTIPRSIEQTSSSFLVQARRAEERGAIALIGYVRSSGGPLSTGAGPAVPPETAALADVPLKTAASGDSFRMDKIVVLGIDALQYQELQGFMAQGPVEISIAGEDITDKVAAFSSQGPTSRFTLEPDLVAPGVEIRSTWPSAQWAPGEFRISGTSMAAPHVAGAAALLSQLRPDDTVADTAGALVGSAKALDDLGPTVQGSGRLDVVAAADAVVTSQPTSISMGLADMSGDTVDANGSVRLVNHSDSDVTVDLTADQAPGSPGSANVAPSSATIPAGGSVEVTVRVSADTPGADTEVAGWIQASVADAPDVRVPYLLTVRPLIVQPSPDPAAGTSEVFVYSPTALSQPPTLTVDPAGGQPTTVPMALDHDTWYRARVSGNPPGTYRLEARAWTATGLRLVGAGALEMLARDNRPGGDQWQPIGPNAEAGEISTTAADPDTATVSQYSKASPWITTDGAKTWRQAGGLPVAAGDGTVIVDARDPDRMWYAISGAVGSGPFASLLDPTYQAKLLRTTDGGRTWSTMDFPDTHVYAFVSDPETRVLAAVTADAIVLSRDGGRTWSSFAAPMSGDELLDAGIGDGNLYLSSSRSVWSVGGILDGVPDGATQVYESTDSTFRGMVADDELVGVLDFDNRLVGSRDGGQTWDVIHQFPSSGPWSIMMRRGTIMVGTFQANNFVSRDHGVTWTNVPRPLRGPVEVDFTPWADDSLLFAAEGGGLMRTGADGSDPARLGVQGLTAYDVAVSERPDGSPVLLAGTDSDVYRTSLPTAKKVTPAMAEWGLSGFEGFNGTTVNNVVSSPSEPGVLWKTRQDATGSFWVYRSPDGGATWQMRGRDRQVAFDVGISPVDPQRVVVPFGNLGGSGLFVTRNGGQTWKKMFHDEGFTTVAMDPADPDRLWLGSASGLYRSDNFGETVTKVASGRITTVAVKGDQVVAGGDRILLSSDGGATFGEADAGGLSLRVTDIVAIPSRPNTWYAATSSYSANGLVKGGRGVLRSTDGGRTWVNVSGGLQNLAVESLVASPDGRWLYAGTVQGGVHRLGID